MAINELTGAAAEVRNQAQNIIGSVSGQVNGSGNTLRNEVMTIKDNILSFGSHAVQISNISQMSVQRKKGTRALVFGIFLIPIAITLFILSSEMREGSISFLGAVALLGGIGLIAWYISRGFYLRLEMNSGENFWLASTKKDVTFLQKTQKSLCVCANAKKVNAQYDFSNCTFSGSCIGDDGTVINMRG